MTNRSINFFSFFLCVSMMYKVKKQYKCISCIQSLWIICVGLSFFFFCLFFWRRCFFIFFNYLLFFRQSKYIFIINLLTVCNTSRYRDIDNQNEINTTKLTLRRRCGPPSSPPANFLRIINTHTHIHANIVNVATDGPRDPAGEI